LRKSYSDLVRYMVIC